MPTETATTNVSESSSGQGPIVNIAAYKFVTLDELQQRRERLRAFCREANLKGTVLLSPEGINFFIAGSRTSVDRLLAYLRQDERLSDLDIKESYSAEQPFERMLVKVKPEIIAFGIEGIDPRTHTSRKLPSRELKQWLDEGRDIVLLDTRNDYEVRVGTFEGAVPIGVDHFRDFPEAVERLPEKARERPIVMFCTGGIRCEKAGPFLEQAGFKDVYQLEGGILKYFEDVGGDHYRGECFVFDKRVALDANLHETATTQCYACLAPLTVGDQQSPHYDPPHACPHCYQPPQEKQALLLCRRQQTLEKVVSPLPGSVPYDNPRPLNVPQLYDNVTLLEFLTGRHPHLSEDYWHSVCKAGRILQHGRPVSDDRMVRAGEQFVHLYPAMVEPDVNVRIAILHEDASLVVVNKPAPLPVHPSGRFNRNTLLWILNQVFHPIKLRPAHRLDANTTGVCIFSKTRAVSRIVQPQFDSGIARKEYLARVQGGIPWEFRTCEAPISREPTEYGGRTIDEHGLPARTWFEKQRELPDGTTLLRVVPETGRTNQIRAHLWHLGFPIVNDPLYLPGRAFGGTQTSPDAEPMCLHAWKLTLRHPETDCEVTYEAPAPVWSGGDS